MNSKVALYKMIKASLRDFPLDWACYRQHNTTWILRHKNNTQIYKARAHFITCTVETPVGSVMYTGWRGIVLLVTGRRLYNGLQYKAAQEQKNKTFRAAAEHFGPWATKEGRFAEKL